MISFVNSKKFLSGCCLAAAIFLSAFSGLTFVPPSASGDTFTLTAPFTASGTVGNFVRAPEFPAPEFAPHWYITRAVYEFGNASPAPEPIAFALFGSGLALAAVKYRSRRSNER